MSERWVGGGWEVGGRWVGGGWEVGTRSVSEADRGRCEVTEVSEGGEVGVREVR